MLNCRIIKSLYRKFFKLNGAHRTDRTFMSPHKKNQRRPLLDVLEDRTTPCVTATMPQWTAPEPMTTFTAPEEMAVVAPETGNAETRIHDALWAIDDFADFGYGSASS